MKLWLVRHAAPVGGSGRCYGRSDLPVAAAATADAARNLAGKLPPAAAVRTSPLARCRALAQALAQLRADLQVQQDPRLAEMDFGRWEGQLWAELGAEALDAWTLDFWNHRPGGGESVQEVFARVEAALGDARRGKVDTVWITHAGVIRTAQLLAQGVHRIDSAACWPRSEIAFGSWLVMDA